MTPEQVLNEISSLTPSEQLKIAQVIWDKLPNDLGTDRHKLIDLHRALLGLYVEEWVLVDDLPIDRVVHELPRELDPLVDRRRGHPSGITA
jgi:hypothetical protein